jgi:hypothetical protein
MGSSEFAEDYRKNGTFCRADRVVRPAESGLLQKQTF